MKKAELKQGVAYYINGRGGISAWRDSYFQVSEQNSHSKFYIIFEDGNPEHCSTPSMVWGTHCSTFGFDCQKHKREDGSLGCGRRKIRLMDIRGEFYPMLKKAVDEHRAYWADGGRGRSLIARNKRIADRAKSDIETPIKNEFYEILRSFGSGYVSSYDRIGNLPIGLMKTITEALKASERAGKAVA